MSEKKITRQFQGRQREIVNGYIGVQEFSVRTTMPVPFIYRALEHRIIKGYKKCVSHCENGIGTHEGDGRLWYIPQSELKKLNAGGFEGVIAKGFDWQLNQDILRKQADMKGLPFEPLPRTDNYASVIALLADEATAASGVIDSTSSETAPTIERPSPPPPERPSPPPTTPQKQEPTPANDSNTFTSPVDAKEHAYKFGFFENEAYCAVYSNGASTIVIPLNALEKILCDGWAYDKEIKGRTS